jgi:putative ABC transport system permease protein
MNLQISLAARYLLGRKLRSFLTTLAIVIGVMVIFGMGIMLPTMVNAFQKSLLSISGQVDMTITHKTGEGFSTSVLSRVKGMDGVAVAAGSISRAMNIPINFYGRGSTVSGLTMVGVDPVAGPLVRDYALTQGRFLKQDDTDVTVIATSLADALGLKLGDTLRLPTTEGVAKLVIVGLRPGRPSLGNEEVQVTLAEAQRLLDMPGLVNMVEANLTSKDTATREAIIQQVQAQLGKTYNMNALSSGSEVLGTLGAAQAAFSMIGILTLFMGGFIIFNTFRTIVAERRHDIGMLRAIGASRGTIVGLILTEGVVQGVVGTAIGLALGYLMGLVITAGMSDMYRQLMNIQLGSPVVEPGSIVLSVVLGVGVTLLAGLLPAVSAGRVTPMEVLRPSLSEAFQRVGRISSAVGVIMVAAALLCLFSANYGLVMLGGLLFLVGLVLLAPVLIRPIANGFSVAIALMFAREGTGDLAQGNITRQPSRSAITASATMIGLAIVVGAGGLMWSLSDSTVAMFRKSMASDYLLVPPSIAVWKGDVGASQSLSNKIRSVPGVGTVSTLRFAQSTIPTSGARGTGEMTFSVLGIDPVTYPEVGGMDFQQGDPRTAYTALEQGRNIFINGILAVQAGLKMGDTVTLSTPQGQKDYNVIAVAGDVVNMKVNTAFISQANLKADFNKSEDVFYQINLAQGADEAAVDQRLKTIVADYPQFRLVATRQYLAEFTTQFDAIFAGVYVLLAVLSLPSLIAILNTLTIGVLERTREIGMLRAIGASRGQVRRMVIAEALLLAAIGTAFGLLAGLYLGYVLVAGISATGIFKMDYTFPLTGVLAATAAGLIFGVLAAIIPARQAAKMEIIHALRYE